MRSNSSVAAHCGQLKTFNSVAPASRLTTAPGLRLPVAAALEPDARDLNSLFTGGEVACTLVGLDEDRPVERQRLAGRDALLELEAVALQLLPRRGVVEDVRPLDRLDRPLARVPDCQSRLVLEDVVGAALELQLDARLAAAHHLDRDVAPVLPLERGDFQPRRPPPVVRPLRRGDRRQRAEEESYF